MPRFICKAYPALMFNAPGDAGKFKFVGGKLDVSDEDADKVREFAGLRPQYDILEVKEPYEEESPLDERQRAEMVTTLTHEADQPKEPENVVVPDPVPAMETAPAADEDAQAPDVLPDAPGDAADASASPADLVEDDTQSADQPNAAPLDAAPADMTNSQINAALKEKGLSTRGSKDERLARLISQ